MTCRLRMSPAKRLCSECRHTQAQIVRCLESSSPFLPFIFHLQAFSGSCSPKGGYADPLLSLDTSSNEAM